MKLLLIKGGFALMNANILNAHNIYGKGFAESILGSALLTRRYKDEC